MVDQLLTFLVDIQYLHLILAGSTTFTTFGTFNNSINSIKNIASLSGDALVESAVSATTEESFSMAVTVSSDTKSLTCRFDILMILDGI